MEKGEEVVGLQYRLHMGGAIPSKAGPASAGGGGSMEVVVVVVVVVADKGKVCMLYPSIYYCARLMMCQM